jgi:PDZ domain-containing protein
VRRRGATLLVGSVILLLLIVASFAGVEVPYVALTPGPTWNTLGTDHSKEVVQISGGSVSTSKGQLRMVTVGVRDEITLWEAMRGWLSDDDAVVPRDVVYPPGQTQQETDQENQKEFKISQSSAVVAALRELGYPVHVLVKEVPSGSPSQGRLSVGDQITTVDGAPVTSGPRLTALIRGKPAGSTLTIGYIRNGASGTTTVTTAERDGAPRIGVNIDEDQPSPYKITISLDNVGGPSAGLMFTLAIIDKLKPEDLTGGLTVAGTGAIDEDGKVGAIGGIPQKLRGARRDGSTVFLTPAPNCAEARANAIPGLKLVKVTTVQDALIALATLRSGGAPALC